VLLAYAAPEDVVVGEGLPPLAHLGSAAEGGGIEIGQDLERHLAGEHAEWVDADQLAELFCEQGKLRETAHGENALEDEFSPWVRR